MVIPTSDHFERAVWTVQIRITGSRKKEAFCHPRSCAGYSKWEPREDFLVGFSRPQEKSHYLGFLVDGWISGAEKPRTSVRIKDFHRWYDLEDGVDHQ